MANINLSERLPVLQDRLRKEIPFLNRGGCGRFAYLMGKRLKRNGIPFKIKVMLSFEGEEGFEERVVALNAIKNNRGWGETAFSHCYIEADGVRFDGHLRDEEFRHKYNRLETVGEYSLNDMFIAVKNGSWNDTFDVENELPKLEKIINEILT